MALRCLRSRGNCRDPDGDAWRVRHAATDLQRGRLTMSKKKTKATSGNLPALRIGSRVRCTDDGVEGRIVWANAISVKIEWTDGEKVTWRRDALASKPIE